MSSIAVPLIASQPTPQGLRVLRQRRGFLETVEKLDRCCAAHPGGCGHEAYCLQRYDARCDQWTYVPHIPAPARRRRPDSNIRVWSGDSSSWIPILNLHNTLHSMRRMAAQEG